MHKHEYFEELCSLAILGELEGEEYEELNSHLRSCSSCEAVMHDFNGVVQHLSLDQVPPSDAQFAKLKESALAKRFLQRARGEGIVFSREAVESVGPHRRLTNWWGAPSLRFSPAMAAVLVVAVLVGAGSGSWLLARQWLSPVPPQIIAQNLPPAANVNTQNEAVSSSELAQSETKIAALQDDLKKLRQQLSRSEAAYRAAQDRAKAADALMRQSQSNIADLSAKVNQQNAALANENSALQKAQGDRDQAIASLLDQQQQIQSLQSEVKLTSAKVDQEKQLSAAAHDVREMMGARKLHIVDVYDSQNPDRENKSFGRIIYTENKSLIFYAFDLDQLHRGTKVTFHAWGEHSGDPKIARKLGTFSLDDERQKRWVLKVQDMAKLKSVDTVFVTVESDRDPIQPSGHRYLQAYLGSRANHP